MAKSPIQQFNINASQAVKVLSSVTANLKLYNKEVKEATKNHKAYNSAATKARDATNDYTKAVRSAARETGKTASNMALLRSESLGASRNISKLSAATVTLGDNTKAAGHFMLFAAKNAARLGIDLSKAASSVRTNERALQRDTQALRDNVTSLRSFGKEINRIVQDMQLKNRTIDQQVAAAHRDSKATNTLERDMAFLAKIIFVQLAHKAFGELIQRMTDSVKSAQELQIRIGEIQTVSLEMSGGLLQTAKSTDEWSRSLLSLSRNFGINTLEQAEGIYDALSNQVVKANQATQFMAEEMKLAITTVSSLNQAVDVTSTVINAYGKTANDASQINAVLFRGVDVGRFRLDELGSSFGRTNVLANQLGVTFEEVTGTLALLTRLGLKADVANTLLTNTFNGLIKPTKEMTELFNQWGVSSGEAAISTFGFTGVFRKLAEVVQNGKGELTETATLFEDLRALTGASGLIKNLSGLEKSIYDVSNATTYYNKAFEVQQENLGVRGRVQLEQFKQYFLVKFGLPIQRNLVELSEGFGGAGKAVDILVQNVRRIVTVYTAYRIAALSAASANVAFAATARSAAAAQAGMTLGLTIVISVLAEVVAQSIQARGNLELLITELEADAIEKSRKSFERFSNEIDAVAKSFNDLAKNESREWFETTAAIRQLNSTLSKDFEENFKKIKKSVKAGLGEGVDLIEKQLTKLRNEITKSEKAIADATERLAELKRSSAEDAFDASINGLTQVQKIKAIEDEKQKIFDAALAARKAGEDKAADDLLKREEKLRDKQIELLNKLREEAAKEVVVGTIRADTNGNVRVTTGQDGNITRSTQIAAARRARLRNRGLGIGRPFTIGGGPPTGRTTVTEEVKDVKDAERVKQIDKVLSEIESRRKENAQALIKLEEDLIKKKEENLAKQKQQEADRLKAFEAFKDIVTEIDAIDATTDPKKLQELIKQAEAAGRNAGLSGKDLFDTLRDANKQRLLLARESAAKETEIRVDAVNREIAQAEKAKTEAFARQANAVKNQQNAINQAITRSLTTSTEIEKSLEGRNKTGKFDPKGRAIIEARKILEELQTKAKLLQDQQTAAGIAGKGFVTPQDIASLDALNQKLEEALIKLNTFGNKLTGSKTEAGQLTVAGTSPADTLVRRVQALAAEIDAVKVSANEIAVEQQKVQAALSVQTEAQQALNQLKITYGDLNVAVRKSGDEGIRAQEAINSRLDDTIARLKEIIRLRGGVGNGPEGFAHGGTIVNRAFGGRGTDRHLTATSVGEFISTRLATRQYAPLLASLNKQPPAMRANGGTTVNFGDININAPEGTTSVQASDIASKLTRLARRGLYKK